MCMNTLTSNKDLTFRPVVSISRVCAAKEVNIRLTDGTLTVERVKILPLPSYSYRRPNNTTNLSLHPFHGVTLRTVYHRWVSFLSSIMK